MKVLCMGGFQVNKFEQGPKGSPSGSGGGQEEDFALGRFLYNGGIFIQI